MALPRMVGQTPRCEAVVVSAVCDQDCQIQQYVFTLTGDLVSSEQDQRAAIERVLFPSGASHANEENDVDVVFNAAKHEAILVTADGGSKRQPARRYA